MKITKNPEVGKLFWIWILLLLLSMGFVIIANVSTSRYIKDAVAYNHAAVMGTVVQYYPEAEREVAKRLKEYDQDTIASGKAVLSRYGLYGENALLDTELLDNIYTVNFRWYLYLIIIMSTAVFLVSILFLRKQYSRIDEVTQYAKRIQGGDYSLDLRDNSEGEISKLKNEIYKITTMLREQAERLHADKIYLANSIADISHQVKTPMTSLFVLNDLLYEDLSPEIKNDFLNRVKSQLERIEWLVTSLLKLSKLDSGTVSMKKETIVVNTLIRKALEPLSIPLEIKLQQVHIRGDESIQMIGDFNWTCEAIINVLKNCIEHTPENGSIKIAFECNPIYTMISISDTGEGIDKEDVPYVFNRFYKGKNAGEDSVGIGLAMSCAIIKKQNGDIQVKSEKGNGTTFIIKFFKSKI